jgi:hypothetical protein
VATPKNKKRQCTGKTVRGKRCKAPALKGKTRCAAHPLRPGSSRFGSPEQAREAGKLGGRPRLPRPHEELRKRIEADIDKWLAPLEEALGGAKPVLMWDQAEGKHTIEFVADPTVAMKAIKLAFEQVYGRPRQQLEITGGDGAPIEIGADIADPKVKEALFDVARAIDARRRGT